MNIHEYQSKQIMREYGIHVPEGYPAFTVEDALENAKRLDTPVVVVKAQIHAAAAGRRAVSSSPVLWMKSENMRRSFLARCSSPARPARRARR